MDTLMGSPATPVHGLEEHILAMLLLLKCDEPAPVPSPDFLPKLWRLIETSMELRRASLRLMPVSRLPN